VCRVVVLIRSNRLAIELLSLDAGGVLVFPNFERISETLARHGVSVAAEALQAADPHGRLAGDTAERVAAMTDADRGSLHFRVMFERAGVPPDAPVQDVLDELWAYHSAHNLWEYVPPDVVPALERLAATGLPLAIGSNANGIIHRVFERTRLRRYFSVICDSHVEGVEKPDRRFFEILVARAGGRPETTLHVGDLYHVDVVGARRAGLQAALLDPHDLHPGADVLRVGSLDELVTVVTGLSTTKLAKTRRPRSKEKHS
jgi:putative hydrolase of the HAD superfamily